MSSDLSICHCVQPAWWCLCFPSRPLSTINYPLPVPVCLLLLCLLLLLGTLLVPRERTADVYLRYASKYGCTLTEHEVLERFRR